MEKLLNLLRLWRRAPMIAHGEQPERGALEHGGLSAKAYEREWYRRQRQALREAMLRDAKHEHG